MKGLLIAAAAGYGLYLLGSHLGWFGSASVAAPPNLNPGPGGVIQAGTPVNLLGQPPGAGLIVNGAIPSISQRFAA